jgi:hypothetical protein
MLEIEKMSEILEDFARQFTVGEIDREFFSDFLIYNDLGLPLAQCIVYNLANLTSEGRAVILETWINMCELLDIDPNEDYEDFDEMIDEFEIDDE